MDIQAFLLSLVLQILSFSVCMVALFLKGCVYHQTRGGGGEVIYALDNYRRPTTKSPSHE